MRCDEVQDRLTEYVAGSLPEGERARVDAHLRSGCPDCAAERDAIEQAVGLLAEGLPPVTPRAGLRDDVLAAVENERVTPATAGNPASEQSWAGYLPYLAVTVCAAVMGVAASLFLGPGGATDPGGVAGVSDPAADEAGVIQWRRRVAAAEREFGPPRAQLTGMPTRSEDPRIQAVVFYDPLASQMHVLVAGVEVSDPGRRVWAWFVDDADVVLFGGPLDSIGAAQASGVVDVPGDTTRVRGVLLTDEPAGDHAAPTGPELGRMQIGAEL